MNPPAHRILIVDNDADLRRMYRTALALAGFLVEEAPDGIDGLRRIEENQPDLLVLDILLSDRSGMLLRQEIAAHANTRRIPIVIVTSGQPDPGETSADCILRKPVSPEQLVATVWACLKAGAPGLTS